MRRCSAGSSASSPLPANERFLSVVDQAPLRAILSIIDDVRPGSLGGGLQSRERNAGAGTAMSDGAHRSV